MNGLVMMMNRRILIRFTLSLLLIVGVIPMASQAWAGDMPTAAGSPIAGISFDDRPLMLPVQRNFQMAMLTASSELGRSCGRMEAYGWRMASEEQDRVNQIFNNTVDRMRAQGFAVESRASSAVSRDVTLFTADRTDRHLIFLWSAGEIGLVMVLCETSAPLASNDTFARGAEPAQPATFPSHLPMAQTVRSSGGKTTTTPPAVAERPTRLSITGKPVHEDFSPVGKWIGNYTCSQGTTGATLAVDRVKGDQFEGSFYFYPTAKNPYVPTGKYTVFGEYDGDSLRILINPGKWIDRPKDYYSTIMIGSFDPVAKTFSGYFQGIMGCTSFEARADKTAENTDKPVAKAEAPKKKKVVKKAAKPKAASSTPKAEMPKAVTSDVLDPAPIAPAAKTGAVPKLPPMSDSMAIVKDPAPVAPTPTPLAPSRSSAIEPPSPGIVINTFPSVKK